MNKFEELGIDAIIAKAITEMGFETPTPIQLEAIPELIKGNRDLIGLAQTGTGKTAAFGLPLTKLIDFEDRSTQALIICPTRELCLQITRDLQSFTKYVKSANIVAIYGGASIETQIREVSRGTQIIVATPGRMVDMIKRRRVKLQSIKVVVLDEADEMLNMGFKEDLDSILSETPSEKNTWLFSATMPYEVARIAKAYMSNPFEITVGKQNQGADNIEHKYYVVQARDKYSALKRIADYNPDIFGIVFCRTRMETQEIAEKLIRDGYNADALHGDLSQQQRDSVMKRYRGKTLNMLVATDVAARGIDVNNVTHVINYNLPDDIENYTHRSGRTARAGKSGVSIVIINSKEIFKIKQIEKQVGKKFIQDKLPGGVEVCEKQLIHLVNKIHDIPVNEREIEQFLPQVNELLKDLTKEELIKRMLSEEFSRFLDYYKNAPDLNVDSSRRNERGSEGASQANENSGRFFINVGEMDDLNVLSLRDMVCKITSLDKDAVGRIDVKSSFSFFEVEPRLSQIVSEAFKGQKLNGRSVRVEASGGGSSTSRGRSRSEGGSGGSGGGGGFRRRTGSSGGGEGKGSYGGGGGGSREKRDFSYGGKKSSTGGGDFKKKKW